MNVGSLFSGIGGIDLGLERAGMRVVFQAEADSWRRGILKRHWPEVPCFEDVDQVDATAWPARVGARRRALGGEPGDASANAARSGLGRPSACDLLCGGFPCQDLSVAGRRAGLAGDRSSLFFEFARVAESLRPRWLLVENVPGLLSSHGGRDFAVVLATLAELGYGVCWRVLDSRFFGVAQRRRRVFVVGRLGADSTEPFLPFLEGGNRDSAPSREAGKGASVAVAGRPDLSSPVAGVLGGLTGGSRTTDLDGNGAYVVNAPTKKMAKGTGGPAGDEAQNLVTHSLTSEGHDASEDGTGRGTPMTVEGAAVRRLTTTECCRLQGFPDDWLGEPNEPPDSPRYAALGDAVTVNVAQWIGERIMEAERLAVAA